MGERVWERRDEKRKEEKLAAKCMWWEKRREEWKYDIYMCINKVYIFVPYAGELLKHSYFFFFSSSNRTCLSSTNENKVTLVYLLKLFFQRSTSFSLRRCSFHFFLTRRWKAPEKILFRDVISMYTIRGVCCFDASSLLIIAIVLLLFFFLKVR